MKVMHLTDIGRFEMAELPDAGSPGPGEVKLEIESVGVCGSDIHYFNEGKIGTQVVNYPFTPGHEFSALIAENGPGTGILKPGTRVAVDPAVACGECDQCLENRRHTCRNLVFAGAPEQMEGALKEYIILPAENIFPVPDNFSPGLTAFVEPLSIGAYAVKLSDFHNIKNTAVLGTGPIGLSVILSLRYFTGNDTTIFATDKIDSRLEVASSVGADYTANPDTNNVPVLVSRKIPQGLDTVFECCGKQEALDQAIDLLKPGGELVIVGIPEDDRISFDISAIRRKEITIKNVRRQNDSMEDAIKIARKFKTKTENLVTHHFSFGKTQQAFDTVSGYKDNVIKAVIDIL